MKSNENQENRLVIYTILLNKSDTYDWFRIVNKEKAKAHMKQIAKLGGTKDLYLLETPDSIHDTFIQIANALTPKYGLKLNN